MRNMKLQRAKLVSITLNGNDRMAESELERRREICMLMNWNIYSSRHHLDIALSRTSGAKNGKSINQRVNDPLCLFKSKVQVAMNNKESFSCLVIASCRRWVFTFDLHESDQFNLRVINIYKFFNKSPCLSHSHEN